MQVKYSTQIPNKVFDDYLPKLKLNELKVLLIILRQTIGFRKDKDWISSSQMEKKTGLSRRSISGAIDSLVTNNLISAQDDAGNKLLTAQQRKGKMRIFFGSMLNPSVKRDITFRKKYQNPAQNLPITKDNYTNSSYRQKNTRPNQVQFIVKDGVKMARYI